MKKVTKAKVAVFTSGLDIAQTETKGTVLLKTAEEMLNFTSGEEKHMEKVRQLHRPSPNSLISKINIHTTKSADLQTNRRLRRPTHRRRVWRGRTCASLSRSSEHRRPQSSLQIRSPSSLSRRQRYTTCTYGPSDTRRNGLCRCSGGYRDRRRPRHCRQTTRRG